MTMQKPTKLKHLSGTLRPDRVHADEPQPPAASGYCPRDLPQSAKHWWHRIVPTLHRLGLLTVLDVPAARDMVICAARLAQAEALIEKAGLLIKGARGGVVRNPAIAAANQYRHALYSWAAKFGMTPSDRAGLKMSTSDELNALEKFIAGLPQDAGGNGEAGLPEAVDNSQQDTLWDANGEE